MKKTPKTEIFSLRTGEWGLLLDGEIVAATWNSRGAAKAAIEIEKERRKKRLTGADHPAINNKS